MRARNIGIPNTNTATKHSNRMPGEGHPTLQTFSPAALKELYINYRLPLIQWLIKTYTIDVGEATELAQSAFAIFVEKSIGGSLPDFRTDSNIKSYLFAIAKNKARELKRQFRKTTSLTDGHLEIVEEEHSAGAEEKKRRVSLASKAFGQLGTKCQELLRLAIVFKLSMQEIAEQLHYENTNTAKTLKYKCLLRLRKLYVLQDQ